MSLFLPFVDKAKATELIAIEVKRQLGVGTYDSVDPYAVLQKLPARIIERDQVDHLPDDIRADLFGRWRDNWSAVGIGRSPAGEELILMNHTHAETRQRASLMEEVVHIVRGHPRVRLEFDGNGRWIRPYDSNAEDEAYNVGAACVIPYRWLFNQLRDGNTSLATLAVSFGVSEEYVTFRIKRAGLFAWHRKQRGAPTPERPRSRTRS